MKILTRYILKEMIGPTLLGLVFYTSIILMQSLFSWAGMIIRQSLSLGTVGRMLLLSLPHIIVLTIPMSLLFGILIAVGRLSSDSEIIAMRALGISTRTIYLPVFLISLATFLLNLFLINSILPKGNQQFAKLKAELAVSGAQKEIRPRVFYDDFENVVLYVNDVDARTGAWKGIFVADTRIDEGSHTDEQMAAAALGTRGGQRISVAERGHIGVVPSNQQVWLNLENAHTHVWAPRTPDRYDLNRNATQRVFLGEKTGPTNRLSKSLREMNLRELFAQQQQLQNSGDREDYNLAWVEIHKKFSIPFACITFGVLGLPLGITNRRGGKSSGFSLSIAIILFYYIALNNGEALAGAGKISPALGMWSANAVLLGLGIYLLWRANLDTGARRSDGGGFFSKIGRGMARLVPSRKGRTAVVTAEPAGILNRLDITFPNTIDRYVLREFGKVLGLVMLSTAALIIIVEYTEISNDIREHKAPGHVVFAYFRFFIFQVMNWTLPISVLVSTLVTFGMLSKNNEITAIKSGGISLYRVAMPIVAVAVLISGMAYLLLDFVLPYSTQRVDSLKMRIKKGKQAARAAENQQRLWVVGKGRYLINFLSYDKEANELRQLQIFELHPTEFRMVRRVYAQEARWNGSGWKFSNGWIRSFADDGSSTYSQITVPLVLHYTERPEDFETDVRTPEQMTFAQLRRYIDTVKRAGYSAEQLAVRLYMKTSWPALSIVMALIALPFAFRIGKRGALYGVGVALVLGMVYWVVYAIFTKFGEVGNLPPLLSAWSANILFSIAAVYLFLNVET